MTKKISRWLGILLISALLVAFALIWRARGESTSEAPVVAALAPPSVDSQRLESLHAARTAARERIPADPSRVFGGANNAADVLRRIDASDLADGEKQEYRRLIAIVCDPISTSTRDYIQKRDANKRVSSARAKLSSSYAYTYFKQFCNVAGLRMDIETSALDALDPTDETLQALELIDLSESGETALASERALSLLTTSTSAPAVSRAMNHLVGVAGASPVGADLPFPEATLQENFDAHRIAAERWGCERHGGCGPDEFFSVIACQGSGNCRPAITADIAWRQRYRPGVLRRAAEIHRRLVALRVKARPFGGRN